MRAEEVTITAKKLIDAKPYENEGIRLTTLEGCVDLTPPLGVEFTINFPGGFLFVTHEGFALGLNPLARAEAVKAWADPKFDRLIDEFGNVGLKPVSDAVFERVRDRSLEWHPKGQYVVGKARLMLRLDKRSAPDSCDVLDCQEKAAGPHPYLPPNSVSVNLCAKHLEEATS